jgi:hypothetical protein
MIESLLIHRKSDPLISDPLNVFAQQILDINNLPSQERLTRKLKAAPYRLTQQLHQ